MRTKLYPAKLGLAVSVLALLAASSAFAGDKDASTAPAVPVPVLATPAAKATLEASASSVLHRLNTDARQLRFEGETGSRVWPVYVSEAQSHGRARVRLAYTNAVSVMPEASKVTVFVNNIQVAEANIAASSDVGMIDADVPEGTLEAGYNSFRISIQQRHRVDCSMPATYELWTQVDSALTGISFPATAEDTQADLAELASIPADTTGATIIRAILPSDASGKQIDRMIMAAQAVALRGAFGRPAVEVGDKSNGAPGVALYIGTKDELAARGFAKEANATDTVLLRGGGKSGHYDLFITGQTDEDVTANIEHVLAESRTELPIGSASGLQALYNQHGYRIAGDMQRTFQQLGLSDQEFNGRVFRSGFDLQLPSDFYPADYGKMVLKIDAGYAAGLSQGSQILVRVNDQDVASLSLPKPGGDVFRKRNISVPLGDLRPGTNHVEIEAQLSNAADVKCDAQETIDARKRFVLLEKSELIMPSIARIAHFPNLSATSVDGFPFSAQYGTTHLYLAKRDTATIGAAASFIVRAAANGRRLVRAQIVDRSVDLSDKTAIFVGAINDLPGDVLDKVGLDAASLKSSWSRVTTEKVATAAAEAPDAAAEAKALAAKGESANSPASRQKAALKNQVAVTKAPESNDLYAQWSGEVKSESWSFSMPAFIDGGMRTAETIAKQTLAVFKTTDDAYAPDNKSRIVIAQHQSPRGGAKTWTLITAPNNELLSKTMRDFTAPTVWNQMDGRVTTFDPKNNVVWAIPPKVEGYFIQTAPLNPSNLRLVTAGWLSNNVVFYALGFLALALGLGVITNFVVRRCGTQH